MKHPYIGKINELFFFSYIQANGLSEARKAELIENQITYFWSQCNKKIYAYICEYF